MEAMVARASMLVGASRRAVWAALLDPGTIPRIMPVDEVVSGFRPGQPFEWAWAIDAAGMRLRVKGVVRRMEPERLLEFDFVDPLTRGLQDREHLHRVILELSDEGGGTRIAVAQDGNETEAEHLHAEGGWRLSLHNLKRLVETP